MGLYFLLGAVFLDLFGLGLIRPILPLYVQSVFGAGVLAISWIPAAFGMGKLLADLPAGVLVHRVGSRRLMAAGLLLIAAVDLLSALEVSFLKFLLWRGLAGVGFGLWVTTAAVSVLHLAPAPRRGRYMGSYLLVGDAGAAIGTSLGGWAYERIGVRAPFFLKAAVAAVAAATTARVTADPVETARLRGSVREAAQLPGLLRVALVNMGLFMADVSLLAFLYPLLLTARGNPPSTVGLLVGLLTITQIAGLSIGGTLADRWGRWIVLRTALVGYGAGLLVLAPARSFATLSLATLAVGLASGTARAVPGALVGDVAPDALRGAAMGVFRTLTDVGMIAGPLGMGVLAEAVGIEAALLTLAAVLAALGLGVRGVRI